MVATEGTFKQQKVIQEACGVCEEWGTREDLGENRLKQVSLGAASRRRRGEEREGPACESRSQQKQQRRRGWWRERRYVHGDVLLPAGALEICRECHCVCAPGHWVPLAQRLEPPWTVLGGSVGLHP